MIDSLVSMMNYIFITVEFKLKKFLYNEEGDVNIVSIVVLIGIAVLLAVLFRRQITGLLNNLFTQINNTASSAVAE